MADYDAIKSKTSLKNGIMEHYNVINHKIPCIIPSLSKLSDWDKWLGSVEEELKTMGYKKYNQHHKREDFAYWKTIRIDDVKVYQIGLLFYDFRKYRDRDPNATNISIMFECMFVDTDERIDLCVSKDITFKEFEEMCETFYIAMNKYTTKNA